jgi:hypothetical protein
LKRTYWTSEGRLSLVRLLTSLPINLQAKDVVVTLNGQAAKYIDQAKAILENNKGKPFLQRYCAIKREKNPSYN